MAQLRSPDDIIALINEKNGLAVKNRFNVKITVPSGVEGFDDSKTMDLLCVSTSLPPKRVLTQEGTATKKTTYYPYSTTIDEVEFVFLLDNTYTVKRLFDSWMDLIINDETFSIVNYRNSVVSDWIITQEDQMNNDVYSIKLIDVMPTQVGQIDLSNESENAIQTIPVSVVYKRKEKVS